MRPFQCVCSAILQLPDSNQTDVKCANCGRVFTATGRFLWREQAGNDVPGSSEFVHVPFITEEEERRAADQDKAVEKAFAEAKLPEEDRRTEGDPVLQEPAAPVVETPAAPPASKSNARGDKRSR
jgi:hypothetical protein